MRNLLRRRLHETTADNWTDADLNALLDSALALVQTRVMEVSEDAFMQIVTGPLVADNEWYPLPDGFWYELEVGIKSSATATTFTTIARGSFEGNRNRNSTLDRMYEIKGRFITFQAAPDYSHTTGYQLLFVPTLSLGADDTVPALHQALHVAIPLLAHRLALGETEEATTEVEGVLKEILDRIPLYYRRGGEGRQVRPDAGGPYY